MLDQAMGTSLQHVPYRGTGPAMQDLIAGRIDFLCEIAVTAVPSIKAGTVKGLATLAGRRSPVLPDLPTAAESGLSSLRAYTWTALFLPKGTPPEIVAKLNAATVAAMDGPGLREQLDELAATLGDAGAANAGLSHGLCEERMGQMGRGDPRRRRHSEVSGTRNALLLKTTGWQRSVLL